ncbi:esterase E4 isoform X2 [Cephus cinctus]|uniref:Esterase E4 isoform X2 n=1 Tax=Cephus cinctus TaxID=211228 RepID=A0AAJ7RJH4_CEPCN|nr:esterase E4 isoform X2 [Cephus cinctus]
MANSMTLAFVITSSSWFFLLVESSPRIIFPDGIIEGRYFITESGRNISAFIGIPYAVPPVNDLRFKNPIPFGSWNGTLLANKDGNMCPQFRNGVVIGDENCLFLNVYTPLLPGNETVIEELLPVMVWIHGGAYTRGSGFLSTGDDQASGNFGLKDQVVALQWVQQRIKYFQGDPDRVTVSGTSAGGGSVNLLALSDLTTGLFHQFIIQSGSALSSWGYYKNSNYVEKAKLVGKYLNCPTKNSSYLVTCLRNINADKIIDTHSAFDMLSSLSNLIWGPTDEQEGEGAFITDDPANLLANGKLKDFPFISGLNRDEGLLITNYLYGNKTITGFAMRHLDLVLQFVLRLYVKSDNIKTVTAQIKKFYFGNGELQNETLFINSYTKCLEDISFFYPEIRLLEFHLKSGSNPSYFYLFNYRSVSTMNPIYKYYDTSRGIPHGVEVMFLFPQQDPFVVLNDDDRMIKNLMVEIWTNFVITGFPRSDALGDPDMWNPYFKKRSYLQIGNDTKPTISLHNSFYNDRMDFWKASMEHV